jgi:3-isopropylmalate/(R)-2-methylmalate dehydratase small subunit
MEPVSQVNGTICPIDANDVDTDQIIPKQFLKRIERTGYGEFLFYDWVRDGEVTLESNPILVAGENFGCGSSREHAVWAIKQFGFDAVIAPSFADIFRSNATKNGLLPVALPAADVRAVAESGRATIDLESQKVTWPGGEAVFEIDAEIKHRLLNGLDDIAITLEHEDDITAFEASGKADRGPVTTRL